MITLNQIDGYKIREDINKYRQLHNLEEPDEIKKIYDKQSNFLEEELIFIKDIRLTTSLLPYLKYFPNITSISMDGAFNFSQSDIQEVINQYPNLKELKISEQKNLQSLDLTGLHNLENLELISNQKLKNVLGLSNLENLIFLTFYDNQTYSEESKKDLIEFICQRQINQGLESNIDCLYMPALIEYLDENKLSLNAIKDNIYWCEHLKSGVEIKQSYLKYPTAELYVALKKAQTIVDSYIKDKDIPLERFAIIYQWMCENVKYDENSLKSTIRAYSENGIARGRKGGPNGTVNALVYGSVVCQGYTKAMQLLLNLSGISSFDIGCIAEKKAQIQSFRLYDGKRHADFSDHSILKVNIDGKTYYSDTTWDADRYQNGKDRKYFLLTKEEISKDHELIDEDDVFSFNKSIAKEEFDRLMEFAKERINIVNIKKKIENLLGINIDTINNTKYKIINNKLEELYLAGEIDIKSYNEMKRFVLELYNVSSKDNKDSINQNLTREDQEWERIKMKYDYDSLDKERQEVIETEFRDMIYRRRMREAGIKKDLFDENGELVDIKNLDEEELVEEVERKIF